MKISHSKNSVLAKKITPNKILLDGLWELKTYLVVDVGSSLKVKKGDIIFTGDYEGTPLISGENYRLFNRSQILAIIRGEDTLALDYFIVEVDEAYKNDKTLDDGTTLTVNISVENVEFINRTATVVSPVNGTILEKGDQIIIHHNIARKKNDIRGREINSEWHVRDNIYAIPISEIFMYKRGEDWIALDPYCFVEPIKMDRPDRIGSVIIPKSVGLGYKNRVANHAIIKYTNKELKDDGVVEGTEVITKKYAEYEFVIDGKLMYRARTDSILGVIEK